MAVFAVLEKLAPHIEREVNLILNSQQEADTLTYKLKKIQVGLEVAERNGVTEQDARDWLAELEEVMYNMADVLDEWEYAKLQLAAEDSELEGSDHCGEKVCSLIHSIYLCSQLKHVCKRREIARKVKAASERIDTILVGGRNYINFVPSEGNNKFQESKGQDESVSKVEESEVIGRPSDKDWFVRKLVPLPPADGSTGGGTQIISIVGTGGVGKTKLAQFLYNHPEINGFFQSAKAWVDLSKPFEAVEVAKDILQAFGKITLAGNPRLEILVTEIRRIVSEQKFLLVLDNVWTEDGAKWKSLRDCLMGESGSRILITTRSQLVARTLGATHFKELDLLSDKECGDILNKIALDGKTGEECERLRKIGYEIAKKCYGLPLAAGSVGNMLASCDNEVEWLGVLESPLWMHEGRESQLFRLLKLSYINLSPIDKRRFLSCIVFPKGPPIYLERLIRIWMAYGYLSPNDSTDEMKLKGVQFFKNVQMRSNFFKKLESDERDEFLIPYKVHDIIHEFAIHLAGTEYSFVIDDGIEKEKSLSLHHQVVRKNSPSNVGKLRTFCARYASDKKLLLDYLSGLNSVRVLSVNDCGLEEVPEGVGELIHLRYLDLSGNPIEKLPDSVANLFNLQTLGVENCGHLSMLPQGIAKLINLMHIVNNGTEKLLQFSTGLEKLTGLRTLSEFRAPSQLGCLKDLNKLQGSMRLFLQGLNETENALEEAGKADLGSKNSLRRLELFLGDAELVDDVANALKPPPNLLSLVIQGGTGRWLSIWSAKYSFNNLKELVFDGCKTCCHLPPLCKLPALEKLSIAQCGFKSLSIQFLGVEGLLEDFILGTKSQIQPTASQGWFPKLKKLHFRSCDLWETWEDISEEARTPGLIMPCLKELTVEDCPKLNELPPVLLCEVKITRLNVPLPTVVPN